MIVNREAAIARAIAERRRHERVQVDMSWATRDRLVIRIGEETQELTLASPLDALAIVGSSGTLKVETIMLRK